MTNEEARALAEALAYELDQDLAEQLFNEDCMEDPEEAEWAVQQLVDIILEHVSAVAGDDISAY